MIRPDRTQRRILKRENQRWPDRLKAWPFEDWPLSVCSLPNPPIEVWRSSGFLVQIFQEKDDVERMSVILTALSGHDWEENIEWEELQRLKSECGRGERMAVEIYPAERDVANMRHLWVLPAPLPFCWRVA